MAKKSAASVPAPASSAPSAGPLLLAPTDWFLAPWRNTPPLPRPEPAPFDLEGCLARLAKLNPNGAWDGWKWERMKLPDIMTREEAHFWLLAMTSTDGSTSADIAARLGKQSFTGKLTLKQVRAQLARDHVPADHLVLVLANLLPLAEVVQAFEPGKDRALAERLEKYWQVVQAKLFARAVLPYLGEADRTALRGAVGPSLDSRKWQQRHGDLPCPPLGAYVAAFLGMPDELLPLVSSWTETAFKWFINYPHLYEEPQILLFGLNDPRLMLHHMRRLKAPINSAFLIRGWLANTELAGLDVIRDTILAQTNKGHAEKILKEFVPLVRAPEAAAVMLELQLGSKSPGIPRQWLEDNRDLAVAGLQATASGQGKLAEAAARFLQDAGLKGQVGAAVAAEPAPAGPAPQWLATALAGAGQGKSKLPSWADPVVLPPVRADGYVLDREQVRALLEGLQKSEPATPQPLVAAVKEHADRQALDAFAWRLFELWQDAGCPSKEKWAFFALGHLGGDASVLKLTPLIRAWPGENQHARAVVGLEVLRSNGSDLALMQLNGIAQKLKFQGLKNKAQEFMEAIAKDRGLSREQLADRIVPTLDLDENGSRVFDFGPRRFHLVLGDDLRPLLRDDSGEVKPDLPRPGKADDAARAAEAIESWKALKKQLKEVVGLQVARLELAMVIGRRWPVAEFEALLVRHPLLFHLVRRLLWGGHDRGGKLTHTFRVSEERTYLDHKGKPVKLDRVAAVGIVHPLHLDEGERSEWQRVFRDAGLVSPFPQLGRPVHRLSPDEADTTILTRFARAQVPSAKLKNALEKAGWVRGQVDQGTVDGHSLHFPGADVTALIHYAPGLSLSGFGYDEGQTNRIEQVFFTRRQAQYHEGSETTLRLLRLGQVDPVVVSEVLLFLTELTEKA